MLVVLEALVKETLAFSLVVVGRQNTVVRLDGRTNVSCPNHGVRVRKKEGSHNEFLKHVLNDVLPLSRCRLVEDLPSPQNMTLGSPATFTAWDSETS